MSFFGVSAAKQPWQKQFIIFENLSVYQIRDLAKDPSDCAVVRYTQPCLFRNSVRLYFSSRRLVAVIIASTLLVLILLQDFNRMLFLYWRAKFAASKHCNCWWIVLWLLLYYWVSRVKCWNSGVILKKGKSLLTCEVKHQKHLRRLIVMAANNIYSKHLYFCCLLLWDRCFEKLTKLLSWGKSLCHIDTLGNTPRAFMPPSFSFLFFGGGGVGFFCSASLQTSSLWDS